MRLPQLATLLGLTWCAASANAAFFQIASESSRCETAGLYRWTPPPDPVGLHDAQGGWRTVLSAGPPTAAGVRGLRVHVSHGGDCHEYDRPSPGIAVGFFSVPGQGVKARLAAVEHPFVDLPITAPSAIPLNHRDDLLVLLVPGGVGVGGGDGAIQVRGIHGPARWLDEVGVILPPGLRVKRVTARPSQVDAWDLVEEGDVKEVPFGPGPGGLTIGGTDLPIDYEKPLSVVSNYTIGVFGSPGTVTTGAFLGTWEGRERAFELPLGSMTALLGEKIEPGVFEVRVPFLRPAGGDDDLHVFVDLTTWRALEGRYEEGAEIDIEAGRAASLPGVFVAATPALPVGQDEVTGTPWSGRVRVLGTIWNRARPDVKTEGGLVALRAWLVTLTLVGGITALGVAALRRS